MDKVPVISDAEWDVMDVLWQRPTPMSAAEVVDAVAAGRGWSPQTVKTLLARLVKKRALAAAADGKRYLYRPRVRRDECVRRESRTFLARVFGGDAGAMLCRFVDEAELSAAELDALRDALDRKRAPRRKRSR